VQLDRSESRHVRRPDPPRPGQAVEALQPLVGQPALLPAVGGVDDADEALHADIAVP